MLLGRREVLLSAGIVQFLICCAECKPQGSTLVLYDADCKDLYSPAYCLNGNNTCSLCTEPSDHGGAHDHKQRMVCYLGSWAVYRPGMGMFSIEDIDATLCNNLVYSFVGLDEATFKVKSLDPEYDINKKAFERFVGLKKQNPDLEVTVAIGGWTEGSKKYSAMAKNPALRRVFIDSIVTFIKEHNFDGLDLDWEYPANRGGVPEDKENFVTLCKELRQEFDKHDWLLTAALGAGKATIESAYNVKELARYLDYIHVMAYDYHGKWDGKTGHNAPLYSRDDESEAEKTLNVEYTVNYYLQLGCPPEKLVMGLGLYGRTFLLQDPSNPQFGAPAQPTAFAGPYTREDGFLGYNEICEKQKTEAGLWKVVWQKAHQAPYMFMENMWVSYDDDNSLLLKTSFAQKKGLAGVMVWSIDTDDFKGNCFNGKTFPLLRAINRALVDKKDQRPAPGAQPQPPPPHKPDIHDHDHDHDHDHFDGGDNHIDQAPKGRSKDVRKRKNGASDVAPMLALLIPMVITSLLRQ